ncbi:MAG TPA: type II toxin-antitoxin system RelE/ParE family toxin [Blastocatellia bacterium]|nr:type II toxin-antitoxin system RelE/ParE family toxin [Blastocatellia bacterium]
MFDGQPKQIIIFETVEGARPFEDWLDGLRDRRAVARVDARVTRLQTGNPGDYKWIGEGVYELRIDYGPGYRIYFAFSGQQIVLLLCGGDKATQQADIKAAIKYWKEFQER